SAFFLTINNADGFSHFELRPHFNDHSPTVAHVHGEDILVKGLAAHVRSEDADGDPDVLARLPAAHHGRWRSCLRPMANHERAVFTRDSSPSVLCFKVPSCVTLGPCSEGTREELSANSCITGYSGHGQGCFHRS